MEEPSKPNGLNLLQLVISPTSIREFRFSVQAINLYSEDLLCYVDACPEEAIESSINEARDLMLIYVEFNDRKIGLSINISLHFKPQNDQIGSVGRFE